MTPRQLIAGLALAPLLACACDKGSDTVTAPEPPPIPAIEPPPAADGSPVEDPLGADTLAAPIPTEEDFEEEAAREITEQNLEQMLDELEKEISES